MLNEQSAGCVDTTLRLKIKRWPAVTLTAVADRLSTIGRHGHNSGMTAPDAPGEGDTDACCFVRVPVWCPECVLAPPPDDP